MYEIICLLTVRYKDKCFMLVGTYIFEYFETVSLPNNKNSLRISIEDRARCKLTSLSNLPYQEKIITLQYIAVISNSKRIKISDMKKRIVLSKTGYLKLKNISIIRMNELKFHIRELQWLLSHLRVITCF